MYQNINESKTSKISRKSQMKILYKTFKQKSQTNKQTKFSNLISGQSRVRVCCFFLFKTQIFVNPPRLQLHLNPSRLKNGK